MKKKEQVVDGSSSSSLTLITEKTNVYFSDLSAMP